MKTFEYFNNVQRVEGKGGGNLTKLQILNEGSVHAIEGLDLTIRLGIEDENGERTTYTTFHGVRAQLTTFGRERGQWILFNEHGEKVATWTKMDRSTINTSGVYTEGFRKEVSA